MEKTYYKGITIYAIDNDKTEERLAVLANAISTLSPYAPNMTPKMADRYDGVRKSLAYHYVRMHDYITRDNGVYPANTPAEYRHASITRTTIKQHKVIKIYIPIITDENELISYFNQSLMLILHGIFKHDLLSIKSKFGTIDQSFDELTVHTERSMFEYYMSQSVEREFVKAD